MYIPYICIFAFDNTRPRKRIPCVDRGFRIVENIYESFPEAAAIVRKRTLFDVCFMINRAHISFVTHKLFATTLVR